MNSDFGNPPWKLLQCCVMLIVSRYPFVLHGKLFFYYQFKIIESWSSKQMTAQLHLGLYQLNQSVCFKVYFV